MGGKVAGWAVKWQVGGKAKLIKRVNPWPAINLLDALLHEFSFYFYKIKIKILQNQK